MRSQHGEHRHWFADEDSRCACGERWADVERGEHYPRLPAEGGTMIRSPFKQASAAVWYRAHGKVDQAERLEAALAADGRCRRCGRTLTDPESVAAGIGPDCAARPERRQP